MRFKYNHVSRGTLSLIACSSSRKSRNGASLVNLVMCGLPIPSLPRAVAPRGRSATETSQRAAESCRRS